MKAETISSSHCQVAQAAHRDTFEIDGQSISRSVSLDSRRVSGPLQPLLSWGVQSDIFYRPSACAPEPLEV